MNWHLQNSKGFRENIYTFNELASPKSKEFQGKYIHKYDLQRVSGKIYTLSMNWRLQKFQRVSRKDIHKYDLDQNIIVRAWCNHFEPMNPLLVIWTIGGAHNTWRYSSMGILIIRESADFTLLIIGNPGALVSFFNYIPGLLFPKKIM